MAHRQAGVTIEGLFFGKVADRWPGKPPSAIGKLPVEGRQAIGPTGFAGDAQADLSVHGGADKAIHHYAADHYPAWVAEGHLPRGTGAGAVGENISTHGLTEDALCIGDRFRLGTALVEISQGRQPCWKLAAHVGNEQMAYLFQKSGRTGWYYRVLEPGEAGVGDALTLLDRPNPDFTVAEVTRARLTRRVAPDRAAAFAGCPELAEGWREAFARMAAGDVDEDTSRRLGG